MADLFTHQIEDARFLAERKFAGNFSGMGSGKTLTACEAFRLTDTTLGVIICPPIARTMWKRVFEAHTGFSAQIVATGRAPLDDTADVYIMSYEIATKRKDELRTLLANPLRTSVLICDESHALKSTKAKRTKAILGRGGVCEGADHTWCLTGTPVTRWNDDIFPFMVRAANGALKDKIGKIDMEHFNLRYCVVQKRQFPGARFPTKLTVGNRNTEELNEMLFAGGLAVRRELADVWAEMPPLTTTRLTVQLETTPELKALLKELEEKTQKQIEQGMARNDESLSRTRRLLGMAKVKHSASEIIDRVEAGSKPILVGAWHTDVIDALKARLIEKGVTVAVIDGRTSSTMRDCYQDDFNAGRLDVLIGQIAAMGVAIDLNKGGNQIVVVEEDWSPAMMDQFYARIRRIGFEGDHVHVDIFASDTKLDDAVHRIAVRKAGGHDTIMEQRK
jgi:SNF2 family DNA or RNA helicase